VIQDLGEGGFGTVYKAEDQILRRIVAVKILKAGDDSDKERFIRESKVLAKLDHPNIVTVFSVEMLEGQIPMIVMDYLEGQSLNSFMRENASGLPFETCVSLLEQICEGLEYAHKNGIVHRDLSSANVYLLLCENNLQLVRILDFGLAKFVRQGAGQSGEAGLKLTCTGEILGSPLYLSPETCRGEAVDARSDIYSLGCLLFEMLSGQPPFRATEAIGLLFKHMEDYPESPSFDWGKERKAEELAFRAVTLLCLQKDKTKRPASAAQILQLLKGGSKLNSMLKVAHQWQCGKKQTQPDQFKRNALFIACLPLCVVLLAAVFLVQHFRQESPSSIISGNHTDDNKELKRLRHRLEMKESAYGPKSLAIARCLYDLGLYLSGQSSGEEEAVRVLERFADLSAGQTEFDEMRHEARRVELACCFDLHKNELAEKIAFKTAEECLLIDGAQSYVYINSLIKLGDAQSLNGNNAAAEKGLTECLRLAQKQYSSDSLLLLEINKSLAKALEKSDKKADELRRLKVAEGYADELLSKRITKGTVLGDPNTPLINSCIEAFEMLASFYMHRSDFQNADRVAEKGLSYLRKLAETEEPRSSGSLDSIVAACKSKLGK